MSISEALIQRQGGLEVRVIYDSFGSESKEEILRGVPHGRDRNGTFSELTWSAFTSRLNYRTHRKIMVIDGRIGMWEV